MDGEECWHYHIMVCETDARFIQLLKKAVLRSGLIPNAAFYEYATLHEFLAGLQERDCCDLLLLNVDMAGKAGYHAANKFRCSFPSATLVLVSARETPSIEAFEAMPFRYLFKGYSGERLFREIHVILKWVREKRGEPYIWGRYYRNVIKVRARDIFYIENVKHGSMIYAQKECMVPPFEHGIMSKEKLGSLHHKLKNFGFACPHNSYLVNLGYVEKVMKGTELVLSDGTKLSISRSRAKEFLQQLTGDSHI